uniref:Cytochrome P450 n=1 Tax=Megaselia scalaris TaxID=36166 RepID=T1GYJ8_MEGSC
MFALITAIFAAAICVFILYDREKRKHFETIGIEFDKEAWPLLGSFKDVFLRRQNFFDNLNTVYNRFNSGIVGIFDMKEPAYMIRSPEVVRQIAIKDFDHFVNRRKFFVNSESSLFGNSLFQLGDQKWKDMRSSLSPAF